MSFSGLVSKIEAEVSKVKSAIVTASKDASVAAADVSADAPEVESLVDLVLPGASSVIGLGASCVETLADAVEAAGAAANGNGINVTLDKALVASIQAALPQLKAFAAKL